MFMSNRSVVIMWRGAAPGSDLVVGVRKESAGTDHFIT